MKAAENELKLKGTGDSRRIERREHYKPAVPNNMVVLVKVNMLETLKPSYKVQSQHRPVKPVEL